MGCSRETFRETKTMPVHIHETHTVYTVVCDAVGCCNRIEITTLDERYAEEDGFDFDGDVGFIDSIEGVYEGEPPKGAWCDSTEDALHIALENGWQEGTTGVQYGHTYCPEHKE